MTIIIKFTKGSHQNLLTERGNLSSVLQQWAEKVCNVAKSKWQTEHHGWGTRTPAPYLGGFKFEYLPTGL